jgi:glycerol-3-phosphate dehydrogenase (NAD(P)+)
MAGRNIAVLGAGSWGSALAMQAARARQNVYLWGLEAEQIATMQQERCNRFYLPDISFPENLQLSSDLDACLQQAQTLLIAVPSHAFRSFLQSAKSRIRAEQHIVWATKGLEDGSAKLMHQILAEELPESSHTAVISGPTFAREVALNLPTAVTAAAKTTALAWDATSFLHHGNFRVYSSDDVVGVELGGALKNVLAIAAGIADGLGFGANTRAALITRGLAEIMRLGDAMGAQRETFMGLAGLGDLVLTCTDNQSRNRRMGLKLASGMDVIAAKAEIGQAVEGINTAREAFALGQKYVVELPIIELTYRVLFEKLAPRAAVHQLLSRGAKSE